MMGRQLATLFLVFLWAAATQAYSNKYVFYVDSSASAIQQTSSSHVAFSSWSTSVAINSVTPAANSQVAATAAKAALHVVYQDSFGNIYTQASPTGSTWNTGQLIVANTTALSGTALAATTPPGTNEIHVYFQDQSGNIRSVYNVGSGWTLDSSVSFAALTHTPITAISWNPHNYRVFYIGTNNFLYQLTYTASSGWSSLFLTSTAAYPALAAVYEFKASVAYEIYYVDTVTDYLDVLPYSGGSFGTATTTWPNIIPGGIGALWDNSTYNYVYLQNSTDFHIHELYVTSSSGSAALGAQLNQAVSSATYIASAAY